MKDKTLVLRTFGLMFVLLGFTLAYNPELVSNAPIPEDTFAAIERRVWWGWLIGIGLLFISHHQVKPYTLTLAALGVTIVLGYLAPRFLGIALEVSVARQWVWVGIELFLLFGFGLWYVKQRS